MPLSFPSHQGLIAPLWRRWPGVFDVPALFIGAAMPDVADGLMGIYQGYLGQGIGHSLIGLPLLCVPGGLVLWFIAHWMAPRLPAWPGEGFVAGMWNGGRDALLERPPGDTDKARPWRVLMSLGLGAFSHLFFDLISHGDFPWLYPWWTTDRFFPAWWHIAWMRLPLPGYHNAYPVGPHFIAWVFLGLLGAYMLFRPFWKSRPPR